MVSAVSFSILHNEAESIPTDRCIKRSVLASDYSNWIGVDYVILCHQHSPMWVAMIEDIALSRQDDGKLIFRFSEIRDVWGKAGEPAYGAAFKPHRHNKQNPKLTAFDDDSFFTIGDPLPLFPHPLGSGPLSIKSAAARLSETYDVDPDQVEIIIRHQPRAAK
ncbi:hypothetical protein ACX0KY_13910 [Pseudomonas extremorientalis]